MLGRCILGLLLAAACPAQQMDDYIFAFLRAHPERSEISREQAIEIQKAHMAHIGKMASDGVLVAAGPLVDSPDLRGILIFRGITLEQARRTAAEDPAVVAKRLRVDPAAWRAPAGIGRRVAEWSKANPGGNAPMTKRVLLIYWKTPATPADWVSPEAREGVAGHMEFVRKALATGEALAAGPMQGSEEFVGVMVYRGEDAGAVMKKCEADPFVARGWARPQAFVLYIAEATFERP